ncbi:MAG: hypothetical protein WB611_06700, partial [Stellaceae bacterium]
MKTARQPIRRSDPKACNDEKGEFAMTRAAEVEIDMIATYDQVAEPLDYLFQDPDYRKEDEARLKAWRNEEWHFVGIRARATLKIT